MTGLSRRSAGLLASLLALWCQIVLGATVLPAVTLDPLAGAPICHATDEDRQRQPAQPVHHDCALCVSCLAHAAFTALPPPQAPATPMPRVAITVAAVARQDAPPPRIFFAAQPRGPPALT